MYGNYGKSGVTSRIKTTFKYDNKNREKERTSTDKDKSSSYVETYTTTYEESDSLKTVYRYDHQTKKKHLYWSGIFNSDGQTISEDDHFTRGGTWHKYNTTFTHGDIQKTQYKYNEKQLIEEVRIYKNDELVATRRYEYQMNK